jgi:glycosyltransferase involved in cell wall biosynthesis
MSLADHAWFATAEAAAQRQDWAEAVRIIEAHRPQWPEEPEFLLAAARWLRMAAQGDRANETLLRAAAVEDSFGIAEEARILEIVPDRQLPPPHRATILLDIQDLLQFLHETGNISGIQRVQLGIIAAVLQGQAGRHGADSIAVFPALAHGSLFAPREEDMQALLAYCMGGRRDVALARPLVERLRARALRITPASGSAFIVLGAHWFFAGAPRFYARLHQQGVRLGVLIYDMFPATHPEYTTTDTTSFFNQSLNEGLFFWDFAFAISEYSARGFRRVAAERGYPAIETVAIPLAHSFGLERAPRPAWLRDWPAALGDLEGRDYILAVSTIEARKNHQLLFHAWARMIEEGDNPPPLVLVGRPGWRVGDFMGQLDATRYLNGRILIVHGLSDADLEAVYRGCLFTVMPSFAEGWGLAVGESLSFGRACIAANTSALPEVGGDLVTYADPLNVPEWVAAIRGWLQDRPALAAMQARIAREFTPRQWPEVARHMLDETARLRALPPRRTDIPTEPLRLELGQENAIGIAVAARGSDADGARLALSQAVSLESGWYPSEAGCTWMRGRFARLLVATDAPPGSAVSATLRLGTPGWPMNNRVSLVIEGGPATSHTVPQHGPFEISATGRVDERGMLRLRLELARPGEQHGGDMRQLCISLQHITLAAADDVSLAPPAPPPEKPAAEPQPTPSPPERRALPRLRLPGLALLDPGRRLLQQANEARDSGNWSEAARFYTAYLERRPNAAAILVQRGNMRSMAGDHAGAIEDLTRARELGDANAATMLTHAQERALLAAPPVGPRIMVDLSALLAPPPGAPPLPLLGHGLTESGWAARQWRLGLAQSLAARPEGQVGFLLFDQAEGQLRRLPHAAARSLLAAPPARQREILAELAEGLAIAAPGAGDRLLVLGLGRSQVPLAAARGRGARVTLVLAEPAALTMPHRVAPDQASAVQAGLLGGHAALDGLLLAMPDPGAAAALAAAGRPGLRHAALPLPGPLPAPLTAALTTALPAALPAPLGEGPVSAPPVRYILADGAPAWLQEAWMLLRASRADLPALLGLSGPLPAIGMADAAEHGSTERLIEGAQFLLATAMDGSWPALPLAAARARRACLVVGEAHGLDPLDSRATAQAIAALLEPNARAARVIAQDLAMAAQPSRPGGWDAVGMAALAFDDPLTADTGPAATAAAPPSAPPVAPHAGPQQRWALAASRGDSGRAA